jgi:hypothetical protein
VPVHRPTMASQSFCSLILIDFLSEVAITITSKFNDAWIRSPRIAVQPDHGVVSESGSFGEGFSPVNGSEPL